MKLTHSILLVTTLILSACTAPTLITEQVTAKNLSPLVNIPMIATDIGCFSHDGAPAITSFYVQEPFSKRMVGGLSCGGIAALGYIIPRQWQPGLKVKVRWKPDGRAWIEKTTTIKRYDQVGTIYVHFFQNDEVRIVSTARYGVGSPNHPILKSATVAPPEEE
ncbi:DUF3304 domain-containing protein [Glaciimonas soli]|uniref:DUF3304 domain-containing protein n=1 Tax=Glaciimonas soli TaxID=2590999 RepID=A0A843YS52_9BURK|nr:DUF3304 domain-containing protein [Glaciimonas soli]MQR00191.1 DUF3304 domain-containing protein [Glaciimonas soli]